MILLGLTGSIGMGKSATAQMFREEGAPVYDADKSVHRIYEAGGSAVAPVSAAFPDILDEDGGIDRTKLRAAVVGDANALRRLEGIVHPLVGSAQLDFLTTHREAGAPFVVLDIPLLYETGGDARCDYVAVVSAPSEIQRERVLARGEMSEQDFESILAKQVPDADKRSRADFIISSAFGFDFARAHVKAISDLMIRLAEGAGHD